MKQTDTAFNIGRIFGLRESAEIVCVHCHNKFDFMENYSGRIHDNGEHCDAKFIYQKIEYLGNIAQEFIPE